MELNAQQRSVVDPSTEQKKVDDIEEKDHDHCIVCKNGLREVRLPCGHAHTCEACTNMFISEKKPCPTCQVAFTEYYKIQKGSLKPQTSFADPANTSNFGVLVSTILPSRHHVRHHFGAASFIGKFFVGIGFLILGCLGIALCLLLPALIVAEFYIATHYGNRHCDKPIASWMYAAGAFHLYCLITGCCHGAKKRSKENPFAIVVRTIGGLIILILAAVYGYTTESCDALLAGFVWYYATICFSITAFFLVCTMPILSCVKSMR